MLTSRKFIVGHILVVIIATSCFLLSWWQFSRLSDRKALNTKVESRITAPRVLLSELVTPAADKSQVDKNEYRDISIKGKFSKTGQILISDRSSTNGDPGYNVLTPFVLSNSDVVYVNRGWIPQTFGDALRAGDASAESLTPSGGYGKNREVNGLIRKDEPVGFLGTKKSVDSTGVTPRIASRTFFNFSQIGDIKLLYPLWIQESYDRVGGKKVAPNNNDSVRYPSPLARPSLSDGPHLSYAFQWIFFGTIAIVTWVVVCRKTRMTYRTKSKVAE